MTGAARALFEGGDEEEEAAELPEEDRWLILNNHAQYDAAHLRFWTIGKTGDVRYTSDVNDAAVFTKAEVLERIKGCENHHFGVPVAAVNALPWRKVVLRGNVWDLLAVAREKGTAV